MTIKFYKTNGPHGYLNNFTRAWIVKNSSGGYFSEPGDEFDDTLTFVKMYEYKSARVYFQSKKSGRHYCMFLDAFGELLKLGLLVNNELTGKFRFTKRGQAQGIKMILRSADEFRLKELNENLDKSDRYRWF